MKPINQQERNKAFWRFLMFFVITVGVMLATVLFSANVPFVENEKMKAKMKVADDEKDFLAAFENDIQQTINLLYSLDTLRNPSPADVEIEAKLTEMYGRIQKKDTLSARNLCTLMLNNLSEFHKAKIDQRVKDNSQEKIESLNAEILQWRTAWTNCVNGKASAPPASK